MSATGSIARRIGHALRRLGEEIEKRTYVESTWIDVGAHLGQNTFESAIQNPYLRVYAFEPNVVVAARLMGRVPNYIVIPAAVTEVNGTADFYVNKVDCASSLLPLNETARQKWIAGEDLSINSIVKVPTIRLDTFMELVGMSEVGFLKVDAQGADLAVVRSAGVRLRNIRRITLEADITSDRLYAGSASRSELLAYLDSKGFTLIQVESQSAGQEENLTFVKKDGLGNANH